MFINLFVQSIIENFQFKYIVDHITLYQYHTLPIFPIALPILDKRTRSLSLRHHAN